MKNVNYPIIINYRDRLTTTKKMVEDLFKLNKNSRIHIIDNASTYVPLLEWYEVIKDRVTIHKYHNVGHLALWSTGMIKSFADEWLCYTDSDIELNSYMPLDYQDVLLDVAIKYNINKVGLALRIDDLPKHYIYKDVVLRDQEGQWINKIEGLLDAYLCEIDTTFALIRNNNEQQYKAIRLAGNFTCRHMPWYVDLDNLDDEEQYFIKNYDLGFNTQWTKKHKNYICQIN